LQSLGILRDALRRHEFDPRFAGSGAMRERVASMYFPLLLVVRACTRCCRRVLV
jgi:hypothetical protein